MSNLVVVFFFFFFSSRRRHTRCALVTGVQTCALPISDVVLVNTCGFLDSAKQESLEAIGEAMRENGRVIVTGCMGVESEKIRGMFPDVLAVTGPQQYEAVVEAVHEAVPPAHAPFVDLVPPQGIRLTPAHYASLKLSEGCNHSCRSGKIGRKSGRERGWVF